MNYSNRYMIYADIETARSEIINNFPSIKLSDTPEMLYEFYCAAPCNSPAYFVQIYKIGDNIIFNCIVPDIADYKDNEEIYGYTFANTQGWECRVDFASAELLGYLEHIKQYIPSGITWHDKNDCCINGIFQLIRTFKGGILEREFAFFNDPYKVNIELIGMPGIIKKEFGDI